MKQVVLKSYAHGNPRAEDFELREVPIPVPGDREVLLRTLWLAVDPLFRFAIDEVRLSGATHLELGDVMVGATVSDSVTVCNCPVGARSKLRRASTWSITERRLRGRKLN